MIITYTDVIAIRPYSDYYEKRIRALVGDGLDPADPATLEIMLALPPEDARRVLSRLLSPADVVVWAQACADRARGYAHAADADADADACRYATNAADDAAACRYATNAAADYAAAAARYTTALASRYSSRYAARYDSDAYYAAARSARSAAAAAYYAARCAASAHYGVEHRLACQHALALLAAG